MSDNRIAAQVYGLCADTIRAEIDAAERATDRLRGVRASVEGPRYLIEQLRPVLRKFEMLAAGE